MNPASNTINCLNSPKQPGREQNTTTYGSPRVSVNNNTRQTLTREWRQERWIETQVRRTPSKYIPSQHHKSKQNKENSLMAVNSPTMVLKGTQFRSNHSPMRGRPSLNNASKQKYQQTPVLNQTPRPITSLDKSNCSLVSNQGIRTAQMTPTLPGWQTQHVNTKNLTINGFCLQGLSHNSSHKNLTYTPSNTKTSYCPSNNTKPTKSVIIGEDQFQNRSCVGCQKQAHYKAVTTCKYYCANCAIPVMVKGVPLIERPTRPARKAPHAKQNNKKTEKQFGSNQSNRQNSRRDFSNTSERVIQVEKKRMPSQNPISQARKVELKQFLERIFEERTFIDQSFTSSKQRLKSLKSGLEKSKDDIRSHYLRIQEAVKISEELDLEYLQKVYSCKEWQLVQMRDRLQKNLMKLDAIKKDIEPNLEKIIEKVEQTKYQQFMSHYKTEVKKITEDKKALNMVTSHSSVRMGEASDGQNSQTMQMSELTVDLTLYEPLSFRVYGGDTRGKVRREQEESESTMLTPNSGIFFSFQKKRKALQV